jgi:hypothetical protein
MLVSKEVAENESFDVVIDANGAARELSLKSANVLDFHAL